MKFENIQCLKSGEIKIKNNKINVKYSYNGFGKSSIAKAIYHKVNKRDEEIAKLAPFDGGVPKVEGLDSFSKCMLFDSKFVSETLFQQDSLINDSYNVFIINDEIKKIENDLDTLLSTLTHSLDKNYINTFLVNAEKSLKELKLNSQNNDFDGRSTAGRGFKKSLNIEKVASEKSIKDFKEICSGNQVKEWLSWHNEGHKFVLNKKCPFCNLQLSEKYSDYENDISQIVGDIDFKQNTKARDSIQGLLPYFSKEQKENAEKFLSESTIVQSEKDKLIKSLVVVNNEINKINFLKKLRVNVANVEERLSSIIGSLKLDENYFSSLGKEYKEVSMDVNKSIDAILKKKESLVESFKLHRRLLTDSIKTSEKEINEFLSICGIPYWFCVDYIDGEANTRLQPLINKKYEEDVVEHLSFGEKNVLSVALFSAMAKKEGCDLILLDDPISSFDENKKFALMHFLFNNRTGLLHKRTTILFTHDFEPVVNVMNGIVNRDNSRYVCVLTKKNGIVAEDEIKQSKLINAYIKEKELADDNKLDEYIRLIHLRNRYEIEKGRGGAPYDILSSVEHLRAKPSDKAKKMYSPEIVSEGLTYIKKHISNFDYDNFIANHSLTKMIELYKVEKDPYSKLILFRGIDNLALLNTEIDRPVLFNFITSNFHIENLYLYSIKGLSTLPEYIIDLCDKLVAELEKKLDK